MPSFQLPVAVTLTSSALFSLAIHRFSASKQGEIALPVTLNDPLEPRSDPFDVTLPGDIVDGEPIDETGFWLNMKLRGTLMVIAFVVVVSLQTVSLGYAASFSSSTTTATYLLHVLFAIYLSILAFQSVGRNTIGSHIGNVIHLSVLTTLTFALLGFTALLPRDPTSILAPAEDWPHFLQVIWYVVLALYGLSTVVAVTTPLGPPLHFPVSRIYSEKTVAAITNQAVDNVSSAIGASVWDVLLFSYTTKVVLLGNTAESLDIGDLPIVPGSMRATYIFRSMRSALSMIRLRRLIFWDIRPGSGWELAYRLAYVNRRGFIAQMALAAIGAVLYNAP